MSAIAWDVRSAYAAAPTPVRRHLTLVPAGPDVHRSGLRLTRRGRLFLTLLVAAALFGFGMIGWVGDPAPSGASMTVTVQPGQTLSEIAAAQTSGYSSVREAVAAIQVANNLPTSAISAGEQLVIPQR